MKKSFIYTCTGDTGTTSLVGGKRLPKDDTRIEAYGTIDELSANVGLLATSANLAPGQLEILQTIQNKLFNIGSYLATDNDSPTDIAGLTDSDIGHIEQAIDSMDAQLPPLRNFVLPGGTATAAIAHVCRTVARRAERRIVTLSRIAPIDPRVMKFINRLSDYFFVLARFNNVKAQVDEIFWNKDC